MPRRGDRRGPKNGLKHVLALAAAGVSLIALVVLLVVSTIVPPTGPDGRRSGPAGARTAADVGASRSALQYDLSLVRAGRRGVPRIYLASLPGSLVNSPDVAERKALFIRILLPLILAANEDLRHQRRQVRALVAQLQSAGVLAPGRQAWLDHLLELYGARDSADLLQRVDEIPPSLALGQAILESGWGGSRFAQLGNALYGQREWGDTASGLVPEELGPEADFRVRVFDDLMSAVKAYMHNLNSHEAYATLRATRTQLRALGLPLRGLALVEDLRNYTNENQDYVRSLRQIIVQNGLTDFDHVALADVDDS